MYSVCIFCIKEVVAILLSCKILWKRLNLLSQLRPRKVNSNISDNLKIPEKHIGKALAKVEVLLVLEETNSGANQLRLSMTPIVKVL